MPTVHTDHTYLRSLIAIVQDFPKPGIRFLDIMPLLASFEGFSSALLLMHGKIEKLKIDRIVALESRGFFFATGMGYRLRRGVVAARKKGKLPPPSVALEYTLEYGTDTIEVPANSIHPGENVLVVDDLLATGGSAEAACKLVKKLGGIPIVLVLIELEGLGGRARLEKQGIRVESVLLY